jgi:hypothetical protein
MPISPNTHVPFPILPIASPYQSMPLAKPLIMPSSAGSRLMIPITSPSSHGKILDVDSASSALADQAESEPVIRATLESITNRVQRASTQATKKIFLHDIFHTDGGIFSESSAARPCALAAFMEGYVSLEAGRSTANAIGNSYSYRYLNYLHHLHLLSQCL